jgi:hypothetical protein
VHEVDAGAAPDIEHAAAFGSVELHQPPKVMQLLEVVLVEIREEAWRAHLVPRDREIVDVRVPVRAYSAGLVQIGRNRVAHDTLL